MLLPLRLCGRPDYLIIRVTDVGRSWVAYASAPPSLYALQHPAALARDSRLRVPRIHPMFAWRLRSQEGSVKTHLLAPVPVPEAMRGIVYTGEVLILV